MEYSFADSRKIGQEIIAYAEQKCLSIKEDSYKTQAKIMLEAKTEGLLIAQNEVTQDVKNLLKEVADLACELSIETAFEMLNLILNSDLTKKDLLKLVLSELDPLDRSLRTIIINPKNPFIAEFLKEEQLILSDLVPVKALRVKTKGKLYEFNLEDYLTNFKDSLLKQLNFKELLKAKIEEQISNRC